MKYYTVCGILVVHHLKQETICLGNEIHHVNCNELNLVIRPNAMDHVGQVEHGALDLRNAAATAFAAPPVPPATSTMDVTPSKAPPTSWITASMTNRLSHAMAPLKSALNPGSRPQKSQWPVP